MLKIKNLHVEADGNKILNGINLETKAGEVHAIMGPNGSGKSTFSELVCGLRDPLRGAVLADGIDLRQTSIEWWRQQICYLPQRIEFLAGTLRDNLCVLNPDADDAALNEAIRRAGFRERLAEMPDGLDTMMTEQRHRMSQG